MLIGRLGKNPEVKYLGEGESSTCVAKFSLATSESKKKGDEWKEFTEWHDIVVWRQLAERCGKLEKGQLVYIEGKLVHRKYEDKEGVMRYVTEVNAFTVRLMEKRGEAPANGGNEAKKEVEAAADGKKEEKSDDLPF